MMDETMELKLLRYRGTESCNPRATIKEGCL
jgi:hypothetical protein